MQFVVTGMDGTDEKALERRKSQREKHLQSIERMKAEKTVLFAAALTDESGKMIGSMIVCDFSSKEALEEWLETEPYVSGKVWQEIGVVPCKVADAFKR